MNALLGGALIGIACAILLLGIGRVAGMSGIVGGLLTPSRGDVSWRLAFLAGLSAAGWICKIVAPAAFESAMPASPVVLIGAGLLVGYGTRLSNGCTSGHGLCGNAQLSTRSIVATITFIAAGMITVFIVRHVVRT